jgi:hypothetical protein
MTQEQTSPYDDDYQAEPQHFDGRQLKYLRYMASRVRDRAMWFIADCEINHHYNENDPKPELMRDLAAIEGLIADLRAATEKCIADGPNGSDTPSVPTW